ncbi:MAG: hypothetical protein JWP62_3099 [Blastococcus sp.]|nr:hypothetical protein [Blastococcus sp.]
MAGRMEMPSRGSVAPVRSSVSSRMAIPAIERSAEGPGRQSGEVARQLQALSPEVRSHLLTAPQRHRGNRGVEGMPQGRPLPDAVRTRMQAAFGADFSGVTVRQDDEAAAMDAEAFTRGEGIAFAPGVYDPHSSEGLEVIGHELAHVLQQRAGRVHGAGVSDDPVLEAEADQAGHRAARGRPAWTEAGARGGDIAPAPAEAAAVPGTGVAQRKDGDKDNVRRLQQMFGGQANPPAPANPPARVAPPQAPPQARPPAVAGPPPAAVYANAQGAQPAPPQPAPQPARPPAVAGPPPAAVYANAQGAQPAPPQPAPPQPAPPPAPAQQNYGPAFVAVFDPELRSELQWAIDRFESVAKGQIDRGRWTADVAERLRDRFRSQLAGIAREAEKRLSVTRRQTGRELADLLKRFDPASR